MSYICNEISSNPKLKKIPIEEQKKIEKRLIAGADGMWVNTYQFINASKA